MILLILGLALWWVTHLEKILAPGARAAAVTRTGEGPWKGLIALVTLGAVAMMVIGYRNAAVIPVWTPSAPWLWHLNNALMAIAVFVFIAGSFPSVVRRRIRNPQLTAVKTWGVAHLLVNGDVASFILFGGMLAWAVVATIGTKRRDGPRGALPEATWKGLAIHVIAAGVLFGIIIGVHVWAGYPPFPP